MDFNYSASEEAFRNELRTWLEENLPKGWLEGNHSIPKEDSQRVEFLKNWQLKLFEGKWAGISWPKEYGGRGATLIEEVIFEQEMARVLAPPIINLVGINMVGPTLLQIGTENQKEKYVNNILGGKQIWCQGYSEPNAGSDLAALQTRAEKKGDKWIINGQKIWTSFAQYSDYCFLLARTDKTKGKHRGITAFIVDMKAVGVEVRPIHQIDDDHKFAEVFFTDVEVDETDVVGEVDDGWKVSLTFLSHERVAVARDVFLLQKQFEDIVEVMKTTTSNGYTLIEDPLMRNKLVKYRARAKAYLYTYYRQLTNTVKNGKPGPEGSIGKLTISELAKEMLGFALSIQGPNNTLWKENDGIDPKWQFDYLRAISKTIGGGTSEIQKNIIGERILGLPKDIKN